MDTPHTTKMELTAIETSLAVEEAHLVVVDGPLQGLEIPCSMKPIRLGSAKDNDLVLPDHAVSRHHAVLQPSGGRLLLKDLGSTNGTFVADVRVCEAFVQPGSVILVGHTRLMVQLRSRTTQLPPYAGTSFGRLVGQSLKMRQLFTLLDWVAPTDATLFISGPTGTGKEVVARSIHEASPRKDGPFVVLDCGAADPGLISSELFGHEPGAFTGATIRRLGVFEQAQGGTVFIDEVGELPIDLQPKLLRVLDAREVRRLGGPSSIPIDVRVMAATNRNLEEMVVKCEFREDLYYRLCQVKVSLPALDERREDISLLVQSFLEALSTKSGRRTVSPEAMAFLSGGSFPGNVRQLRNIVERAAMIGRSPQIELKDLMIFGDEFKNPGPVPRKDSPASQGSDAFKVKDERQEIIASLAANGYILSRTAKELGIALNTLKARIRKYMIPLARPHRRQNLSEE